MLVYLSQLPEEDNRDGILNYIITRLLLATYQKGYKNYNSALGVLEAVKQEYYRTVVAPYEDEKRKENGEVHGLDESYVLNKPNSFS